MIEKLYSKNAQIIWQTPGEDNVPEPAIVVEAYMGSFSLTQEGRSISINYESIKDLIKVLKDLKDPE